MNTFFHHPISAAQRAAPSAGSVVDGSGGDGAAEFSAPV
jgi:hypothetical protein